MEQLNYHTVEIDGKNITLQGLHEDHVFVNALPDLRSHIEDELWEQARSERQKFIHDIESAIDYEMEDMDEWVDWLYANCTVTVINHNLN